jgi:hypothetical protein
MCASDARGKIKKKIGNRQRKSRLFAQKSQILQSTLLKSNSQLSIFQQVVVKVEEMVTVQKR